jgi:hypothetical protein
VVRSFPRSPSTLDEVFAFLREFREQAHLPERRLHDLALVTEDRFTNLARDGQGQL